MAANTLPASLHAACFSALYTTNTSEQHPYITFFFILVSVLFSIEYRCTIRSRWSIKLYVGGSQEWNMCQNLRENGCHSMAFTPGRTDK